MTREDAISWLGPRYVLSSQYQPQPHHSSYAAVDVRITWARVRHRQRQEQSFVGAVEQAKQKMRLVFGRAA